MESNWRFNKWRSGSTTIPVRLVAQLRNPSPSITYVGRSVPEDPFFALVSAADEQGYATLWYRVTKFPGIKFPYGFDVLPD